MSMRHGRSESLTPRRAMKTDRKAHLRELREWFDEMADRRKRQARIAPRESRMQARLQGESEAYADAALTVRGFIERAP
jgi:hypothetical protein